MFARWIASLTLAYSCACKWPRTARRCGSVRMLNLALVLTIVDRGREPAKGKDGIIQLLDYNLERFDFEDKKGK